jgi:hypothetical protein
MYLNDLNSAKHNVEKLNRVLADSFNHEVNLSSMNMESLRRMLNTTEAKMIAIKESDLQYWENAQYNKLGLIQHQLKTYINEVAPVRSGKTMRNRTNESWLQESDLEQAEVMLAAQELVDEVQKMVENIAEMQVQKLMPIVDAMKEQVGFEQAEAYNNAMDGALGAFLDQAKAAKEIAENATLAARGEAPATPMPTDMGMDAPEDDMDVDIDTGDEENTIGRELKGESAIHSMEMGALAEKKFLESKDKLFKMVESGTMSHDQFINIINELDSTGIQKMPGKMTPKIAKFLGLDKAKPATDNVGTFHSTDNVGTMRSIGQPQADAGGYDEVKPQRRPNTMGMRSTPSTGGYDEVKPQRRNTAGGYDEVKPQRRNTAGGYDEVKPQRRNVAAMRSK